MSNTTIESSRTFELDVTHDAYGPSHNPSGTDIDFITLVFGDLEIVLDEKQEKLFKAWYNSGGITKNDLLLDVLHAFKEDNESKRHGY